MVPSMKTIEGSLNTQPRPANGMRGERRIAFLLVDESNPEAGEISCMSTLRFDGAVKLKGGDKVILTGDFDYGPSPEAYPVFHFDSARLALGKNCPMAA